MSKLKIALCQFELKDMNRYQELEDQIVEQSRLAISSGSDVIVFPEFLTIGLLAMSGPGLTYDDLGSAMVQCVAPFTPRYEALFSELARDNDVLIAAGSHWSIDEEDGKGYNTAYLFFPDGHIARQKKNHLFPGEADWGTVTFDGLAVFDTRKARIGLMTCYDSEFPEVARHFMLEGAEVLLCPSATYTRRGFYRVRRCCAARAVENQIYVAECHHVGALTVPVDQPFTGFGRSAILCPIDDQTMVDDGIIVEAEDGEKGTVVVGEVDFEVLLRSRTLSEATILKDRRGQTYQEEYHLF
jgi:predicted amidohydrolase